MGKTKAYIKVKRSLETVECIFDEDIGCLIAVAIEDALLLMEVELSIENSCSSVAIKGKVFGTKKGKVYMGYLVKGKPAKKACGVTSWTVDQSTGDEEIVFVVPKGLSPGFYDLIVTNAVGSDTIAGGFEVIQK